MTTPGGTILTVVSDPGDDLNRLAPADWWEDHDEPLKSIPLRAVDEIALRLNLFPWAVTGDKKLVWWGGLGVLVLGTIPTKVFPPEPPQ
jgi:hypothetical protein